MTAKTATKGLSARQAEILDTMNIISSYNTLTTPEKPLRYYYESLVSQTATLLEREEEVPSSVVKFIQAASKSKDPQVYGPVNEVMALSLSAKGSSERVNHLVKAIEAGVYLRSDRRGSLGARYLAEAVTAAKLNRAYVSCQAAKLMKAYEKSSDDEILAEVNNGKRAAYPEGSPERLECSRLAMGFAYANDSLGAAELQKRFVDDTYAAFEENPDKISAASQKLFRAMAQTDMAKVEGQIEAYYASRQLGARRIYIISGRSALSKMLKRPSVEDTLDEDDLGVA